MARRSGIVGVVLALWCSALAAGGVAGVVVVGASGDAPARSAPDAAAAPASGSGSTVTTPLPAVSTTVGSAPPVDVSRTAAPAPGAYRYEALSAPDPRSPGKTTTTTSAKTTTTRRPKKPAPTTTTTLQVAAKPSSQGRTVTAATLPADAGSEVRTLTAALASGSGELGVVATAAFGPAGVVERSWAVRVYGGTFTCTWQPEVTAYPVPLAAGAGWSADARCAGRIVGGQRDGADISIHRKRRHEVVAATTGTVAGRVYPTWTITGTTDVALVTEGLDFRSHAEETEQLAPSLGVPTRTESTTVVESFGQKRTAQVALQLVALPG